MLDAASGAARRGVMVDGKETSRVKKKILASAKTFLLQFRRQEKSGAAIATRNAARE
jgi:hypothetical protein